MKSTLAKDYTAESLVGIGCGTSLAFIPTRCRGDFHDWLAMCVVFHLMPRRRRRSSLHKWGLCLTTVGSPKRPRYMVYMRRASRQSVISAVPETCVLYLLLTYVLFSCARISDTPTAFCFWLGYLPTATVLIPRQRSRGIASRLFRTEYCGTRCHSWSC